MLKKRKSLRAACKRTNSVWRNEKKSTHSSSNSSSSISSNGGSNPCAIWMRYFLTFVLSFNLFHQNFFRLSINTIVLAIPLYFSNVEMISLYWDFFSSLSLLRLGSVVGPELKDCSRLFAMPPFATAHTWNKNGIESIDRSLNIYRYYYTRNWHYFVVSYHLLCAHFQSNRIILQCFWNCAAAVSKWPSLHPCADFNRYYLFSWIRKNKKRKRKQ